MKLTYKGIKDKAAWEAAGVALPPYDPEALAERTKENPAWIHFGIGNIFRIFIGGIADRLIREGGADFLVVRSRNAAYPGYTTVDTASFPFEGREWTYHLLQYTGTDETPSDQTEQHRDRRY